MISPFVILVVIALLLAIIGLIWPTYPVVAVAVVLLCVALLIGWHGGPIFPVK